MVRVRLVLALLATMLLVSLPVMALTADAPAAPENAEASEPLVRKGVALTAGNFAIAKGCEEMAGFTPCHRQMTSWAPARADVSG